MKKDRKCFLIPVKVVIFLLVIGVVLIKSNDILMLKTGTNKYRGFYKEEAPFDILFFGSSRVLDAFQPMELWEDYGIRSYNMAQHSENLARDYWQLKNALEHNVPKMVVMDVSMFYGSYQVDLEAENRAALHKQIDHMPLSKTKWNAIKDICPSSLVAEYVFPFILYHGRWNSLSTEDFYYSPDVRMGAEVRTNIMPQERVEWVEGELAEIFIPEGIKLDKIIELCDAYNVPLLFVCMPNNTNAFVFSSLNHFERYFEEKKVHYLNLSKDENFLDFQIDFSDASHVNVSGSLKLTKYIGEYFLKNYEIGNVNDENHVKWDEAYAKFKSSKDDLILSARNDLKTLMMMVYADNDYYVRIVAKSSEDICGDIRRYFSDIKINDELLSRFRFEIYRVNETTPFCVYEE